jgi:hypothetical protein
MSLHHGFYLSMHQRSRTWDLTITHCQTTFDPYAEIRPRWTYLRAISDGFTRYFVKVSPRNSVHAAFASLFALVPPFSASASSS